LGPEEIEERIYQAYEQTPPNVKDVMSFYGVGNHGGGPTRISKVSKKPRQGMIIQQ